jgi:hypothetical protein
MVRPLKLYHRSQAPNPRRVRIFAAEKASNLRSKKLIFWPGKAARLNSSQRTRLVRYRCWSSTTVRILRVSSNLPVPGGASS